jgi:FemAB-related protein (PEP-CTERM system-associated)
MNETLDGVAAADNPSTFETPTSGRRQMMGPDERLISVNEDATEAEWDAYVAHHAEGTIDHAWQWKHIFHDVFGHSTRYLAARRDGQVVGVLPLVMFRSRLFGRFVASVPFLNYGGSLADDAGVRSALIEHARRTAATFGAAHIELRHVDRQAPELPFRQHKLQLTRELPPTSEALWSGIDKKVRNLVRKGQKEGLIAETGGAELVPDFYAVFAQNMRDLGTPVYSRRLFVETLRRFPGVARVHVVRVGRVPVAASITLRHRDTVLVPWASSLRDFRQHAPNMLLYWQMLEHSVQQGARTFDFGRSSPGSGTHQFKRQWGATERPLHWEYVLLTRTSAPDQGPQNPRFSLLIESWKRLPVWVANRLGPGIVRNIP